MIIFECHHCGARISEADEFAGLKRHCPHCEQPFLVPAASSTGKTLTCEQMNAALRSTPVDETEVDYDRPEGGSSVKL